MTAKRLCHESDHDSPNRKRLRALPSFSTVIREAVLAKSLQKFLEPVIRRVVQEELERGLVHSSHLLQRSEMRIEQAIEPSSLQLVFNKPLSLPIFTGIKIEDIENYPLRIHLVDTSGERSLARFPSPIKLEIVVINGEFPSNDNENWTSAEFNRNIVKERNGKRPLLTGGGGLNLSLRNGEALVGDIMFTDNSSWIRSRHFRIGVRVTPGSYEGPRIMEAMSAKFMVKDHRGELYRKHYPPSLLDDVWRLDRIGKDGVFHKKLLAEGINTVQDFLKVSTIDPNLLRRILGVGMSDRMWEGTIGHARTCPIGDKLYMCRSEHYVLLLSPICEVLGMVINGTTCSLPDLTRNQSADVQQLVLEAYRNWAMLEEVDGSFTVNAAPLQNDPMSQGGIESASRYPYQGIEASEFQYHGLDVVGSPQMGHPQLEPNGSNQNSTCFAPMIQ